MFWTDVLRVVGTVTSGVLIASGVGTVPGLLIGAATTGVGNFAADKIEQSEENKRNDELAAQRKREMELKLEEEKRNADLRAQQLQNELNQRLEQESLPGRIIDACRNGNLNAVPSLLQRLTNEQFNQLGNNPLGVCSPSNVQQVNAMLNTERNRRGL